MESLAAAVEAAQSIVNVDDYISAVKSAVRAKVEDLDPAASVKNTGYFNHSAIPDFVVSWSGDKGRDRPLYVRRSFNEIRSFHDVENLAATEPVILALKEDSRTSVHLDEEVASRVGEGDIRTSISNAAQRDVLVTDGVALDTLATSANETDESPINDMLASRVIRSGRGLIDSSQAERLMTVAGQNSAELETSFSEEAVSALRDAVEVVAAAVDPQIEPPRKTGHFTVDEARRLLPWLLGSGPVRRDPEFWRSIGSRLTLKTLEAIHEDLADLDLSPLLAVVWAEWTSRYGYLGLAIGESTSGDESPRWYMNGRLLNMEVAGRGLRFFSDGRSLKVGRDGVSSATWEKISGRLTPEIRLHKVSLRGIDRTVILDANRSPDIRRDISRVLESLRDRFYVDDVSVQFGATDEDRRVTADIGASVATGSGGATIKDLAEALLRIVDYNSEIDLDRVLG